MNFYRYTHLKIDISFVHCWCFRWNICFVILSLPNWIQIDLLFGSRSARNKLLRIRILYLKRKLKNYEHLHQKLVATSGSDEKAPQHIPQPSCLPWSRDHYNKKRFTFCRSKNIVEPPGRLKFRAWRIVSESAHCVCMLYFLFQSHFQVRHGVNPLGNTLL